MSATTELHPSIVALVALSAHLAAGHPNRGLCQLAKLKEYGVSEAQIEEAIEIARHIRDETAQILDASFNQERAMNQAAAASKLPQFKEVQATSACCTPTASGKSCC
jgi:hypothetical protein